jgi:MYXO-CTERM domain-containing protein
VPPRRLSGRDTHTLRILNAVHFAISSEGRSLGGLACLSDLANTLTHEVGHLLGLDHTCRLGNEPARLDNQGNLVPQCSSDLPSEILEATMHPSQECGETKKITLEADDIDAICSVYAMVQDPRTCERVSLGRRRGFCSVGPAPGRSDDLLSLLWPLAAAGLLLFRRRRRAGA